MLAKATKSTKSSEVVLFPQQPALRLIYDTAPIGLACLSLDCRYLQINQRLTEICGRQAFVRILSWQYFRLFQQNRSNAVRFRPSKCFPVCASKQTP